MKIAKYLFLTAIFLSSAGCSVIKTEEANTAPENVNAEAAGAEAVTEAQQALLDSVNKAAAQQADAPDLLVKDLYKVHDDELKNSSFKMLDGKSRKLLDKYFDKNLADLIWKDVTTHQGEIGVIDFDLFYDTQDPNIKNLAVSQGKVTGAKATVPVSFTNSGTKESVTYSLVRQNGAWKIADIKYKHGNLLAYFKDAAKNNAAESEEGNFEGTYQVGDATCTVKPVKMAFELKWAKGTGTMLFFYEGEGALKYVSEDDGKGVDAFVFDDTRFTSGRFIRADGKEMPVRKIK